MDGLFCEKGKNAGDLTDHEPRVWAGTVGLIVSEGGQERRREPNGEEVLRGLEGTRVEMTRQW